eukprot:7566073-Ditylum_brightwellii.AAC.1
MDVNSNDKNNDDYDSNYEAFDGNDYPEDEDIDDEDTMVLGMAIILVAVAVLYQVQLWEIMIWKVENIEKGWKVLLRTLKMMEIAKKSVNDTDQY